MPETPVLFTVHDGHARITLNRPDRLNALTRDLMLRLSDSVQEAIARDDVRVISVTGSGRGFCAGQDLSERDPRKHEGPLDLAAIQRELFHPVVRALAATPKPVVACVNGIAAGAGAGLALAADIVIAAHSAKFAFSFSKVGLSVDAGLGRALAATLGPARARALLMLGETLPASEAAAQGLIWRAVEDGDLQDAFADLVTRLAGTPAMALSGIKAAIASSHLGLDAYLAIEADLQGAAGAHPDYAKGVLAFLERRPAKFS
ncbi:MAG: enoyl-CoA hydratase/isomerase family protein [Rhodobiaceae bacterium]|nr:enoyl-CoA hydratase/isomerase family protein [Rhodobiaceae bacterium]MCC0053199.1 enoyl-CoA hydratase/isomerase family protein [Rhodobiaceae bacterium]